MSSKQSSVKNFRRFKELSKILKCFTSIIYEFSSSFRDVSMLDELSHELLSTKTSLRMVSRDRWYMI